MTRKGSDVRGATIAKAAPQVIVGCGYLMDVILSGCGPMVRRLVWDQDFAGSIPVTPTRAGR